jgi:hypothetical protein
MGLAQIVDLVLQTNLSRGRLMSQLANLPPLPIGMETLP